MQPRFFMDGLGSSYTDDRVNRGGELGISRLAGAHEVIGVTVLLGIGLVVRPIVSVGSTTLDDAGEKLKY